MHFKRRVFDNILKLLADLNGMEWNIAVPHNIVGPNQKYDDQFRIVLSIFIRRSSYKAIRLYNDYWSSNWNILINFYCSSNLAFI